MFVNILFGILAEVLPLIIADLLYIIYFNGYNSQKDVANG